MGLQAQKSHNNKDIIDIFHTITSEEIFGYAKDLSADKYKGRLAGTPEYMESAKYVADHLKKWGIKPAGDNNTYFRKYKRDYCDVLSNGKLSAQLVGKKKDTVNRTYMFTHHFFPGSNSFNGTVNSEVVYVGYGVTAPELKYDDYKGMDVKGKIVLVELGGPYDKKEKDGYKKWKDYIKTSEKMKNAVRHGARGLVFIYLKACPGFPHIQNLIYCHTNKKVIEDLFMAEGKNYSATLKKLREKKKPVSVELKSKLSISCDTRLNRDKDYATVMGIIEGSNPKLKDEVIILGAHLDGQGSLGTVFSSALDNASGVADIMGTARALSQSPIKPKRSVLFLFFGGEEVGLKDSEFYCKNPLFPKEKTVCLINLDMVGNGRSFYMSRIKSYPGLYKHFSDANDKYIHRKLKSTHTYRVTTRPRTDGMMFLMHGFRSFDIFSSDRVKKLYYHHPYDTPETLTPEIMEDASKWLYLSVLSIANDDNLDLSEEKEID